MTPCATATTLNYFRTRTTSIFPSPSTLQVGITNISIAMSEFLKSLKSRFYHQDTVFPFLPFYLPSWSTYPSGNSLCYSRAKFDCWEFSFILPFFLFAGIEFCYLCVQQYFKVVSPAFKNTAANAFLLSANLNFEDSWPNSQLPPLRFVLMTL